MEKEGRPNIVFVMLDTLRASSLKSYGGNIYLDTIESIGKKAAVYENAIAPGTYTMPSHLSLFLDRRVREIRSLAKNNMQHYDKLTDPFLTKTRYVKENEMTLAKHLSFLGYNTALFSNNPLVSKHTGVANGFSYIENIFIKNKITQNKSTVKAILKLVANDNWRNGLIRLACKLSRAIPPNELDKLYLKLRTMLNRHFAKEYGYHELDKGAALTNSLIEKYAENIADKTNFLFVNYMEAHDGYPTNTMGNQYVEQDKWLYLAGLVDPENIHIIKEGYKKRLFYLDSKVKELIGIMKRTGFLDNTVLILAGDHGQAFMEHDQMYHCMFPYNEIIHIPLITGRFIDGKQIDTRERVSSTVSLSALHQSILRVGYGSEDFIDGNLRRDKVVFSDHIGIADVWDTPILRRLKDRSEYAEKIYKAKKERNTFATAIYYKNYKLIHYYNKLKDELYDMSDDPREEENILATHRSTALDMLRMN